MSPADGPDDCGRDLLENVSRETLGKLDLLVAELERWQAIKNLVGMATMVHVWSRHVADSLQLLDHAPDAARWADLGSGAGFPGMVIALARANDPATRVHLLESNARKCAFLRHLRRVTDAPVEIHEGRIEDTIRALPPGIEVVTARALAPLATLLAFSEPLLTAGALGLFPKGRGVDAELTEAAKSWRFDADISPSRTAPDASIVRIRHFQKP